MASRLTAVLVILFCSRLAMSQDLPARNPDALEIRNWAAAPFWVPPAGLEKGEAQGLTPMAAEAVPTTQLPFVGIVPCRIADTRGNGFTGAYGPPALSAGVPRNFVLTGQCGIAGNAQAVSLNVTVTNTQGPGFILIYPQGAAQPTVSTLNYVANETIANAAVVPLGAGGGITVIAGVSGANLILDTNGYYPTSGVSSNGTDVTVAGALNLPIPARVRTGASLLLHNTGLANTFVGPDAGNLTVTGLYNTGVGNGALFSHADGEANTAVGFQSLTNNVQGDQNTAVGFQSLINNVQGVTNTAVGYHALASSNTNGNTAVGANALANAGGGGNIALGSGAGFNNTSGGFNMYLGNEGVASESTTIRIGSGSQHTRMFVAGVLTSGLSGTPVLISGTGQLGIAVSSARYKEDVRDMGDESDRLMKLRPVAFRYKGRPDDPTQFGLIAEEVEKVMPELVFRDSSGHPESVLYNELPPMLLNEIQKQRTRIAAQDEEIATLRKRLESLETRLSAPPAD